MVAAALAFDHAGIVVKTIETGVSCLDRLLPINGWTKQFDDWGLGVSVKFARDRSGVIYELIAPLGENSPVAAIAKGRVGVINQLAYRVADLVEGASHMRAGGATPIGAAKPAIAFNGAKVQFFLSPVGFVIELIEAYDFSHHFE